MQQYYSVFFKSLLCLCFIAFLFSSFQQPIDKKILKERIEWCKQQHHLDSLSYYQKLLQETLQKEGSQVDLFASGTYFLTIVMQWEKLETKEKSAFLQNTPIGQAWSFAFKTQLHLESNKQDSAYFYLSLLESLTDNKSALAYSYGLFALNNTKENNNLKEAVEYLKKAEKTIETVLDSMLLYPVQAAIYSSIGYWDEAISALESNIFYFKKEQYVDLLKLALMYNQLADIYVEQSNYDQAKTYYEEAINCIASRSEYSAQIAKMWYNLAFCYFNNNQKAPETILYLRYCLRQLDLLKGKKIADYLSIDACHLMALEFIKSADLDSALLYVKKAKIQQQKEPYHQGKSELILGEILTKQNQLLSAENTLLQGALLCEKELGLKSLEVAKGWLQVGDLLLKQEKFKQAQIAFDKGFWALSSVPLKKELPPLESMLLEMEGVQLLNSKIEAMLGLYEKSQYNVSLKEIHETAQYNIRFLKRIKEQNSTLKHSNSVAISAYEKGIESCLVSHQRLQDNRYLLEAFQWVDESKKMQILEDMKEPKTNTFGGVSNDLLTQEKLLQKRIKWYQELYWNSQLKKASENADWYQQQIAIFQAQLTLLNQTYLEKYPQYSEFKNNISKTILDSVQQALKTSTAIVQYLEGEHAIYQVIIRKDTLAFRKIQWREYKNTLIKYYKHFTDSKMIQHTASGGYKDFCITSYELYHKLLHHELLSSCNQLVIVPDGLLNYVPFETFLTDIPLDSVHKMNFPSLAYLVKKKSISYHYSTDLWLAGKKYSTPVINNEILGMGATYEKQTIPTFRTKKIQEKRQQLSLFNNAKNELDSLSQKYAGNFYTDRYASEYYLKNYVGSYGILHLAFLTILDEEKIENPSLFLAEDGYTEEDNLLSINDIKQLSLHTSMVVLSNCQSAYGMNQKGEGLIALGRSFMYAGSASVVLTLWEQQEENSSQVLNYFYENIKQNIPKDQALQLAKLRYLKTFNGIDAHPSFWASYILIGDTKAIEISEPVTHIWWFVIPILFLALLGWWSLQALRR